MTQAGDEGEEGPRPPPGPHGETQPDHQTEYGKGQRAGIFAQHGIGHVAAIKLAHGQQVDAGDEDAEPRGNGDGVQRHGIRGGVRLDEIHEPVDEDG
ncbi:MAG: hypothetical protein HZB20_08675 [Chloroflexi bacterium]|nr:hypothetical protein [Chloroflexota bacterium]